MSAGEEIGDISLPGGDNSHTTGSNTRKKAIFDKSTVTSPTNEYAKQAQIYDAEAINTTVNNWNEELPKNGRLADEIM